MILELSRQAFTSCPLVSTAADVHTDVFTQCSSIFLPKVFLLDLDGLVVVGKTTPLPKRGPFFLRAGGGGGGGGEA